MSRSPRATRNRAPWTTAQPADTLPRDAWWTLYRRRRARRVAGHARREQPRPRRRARALRAGAGAHRPGARRPVPDGDRRSERCSATASPHCDRCVLGRDVAGPSTARTRSARSSTTSSTCGAASATQVAVGRRVRAGRAGRPRVRAAEPAGAARGQLPRAARTRSRRSRCSTTRSTRTRKALDLTTTRHDGGVASGLDVARAQTQLDSTRALAEQTLAQRARQRARDRRARRRLAVELHAPAAASPTSRCRTCRPASRRCCCSAGPTSPRPSAASRPPNASIGVARAAHYPAVTLSGLIGYQSSDLDNFIAAPNAFWAIGPSLARTAVRRGPRAGPRSSARARSSTSRARAIAASCSARSSRSRTTSRC